MPKPASLKVCTRTLCQSLLSEFLLGLLFSTLKRQNIAQLLRAEPNPLEMDSFIYRTKKLPFGLLKQTFFLIVICEFL